MDSQPIPPDPAQNSIPVAEETSVEQPQIIATVPVDVPVKLDSKPISLAELTDPTKFQLDSVLPTKKKVTKADFFNRTGEGNLEKRDLDPLDPFGNLDPMWSLKK